MSFVTAIRDYVETLNIISDSLSQNLTLSSLISETFLYILKTIQSGLFYIFSFQWIRDFTLLPIVLPQFSSSIFKETFFLETPSKVFFEFLEIPDLHQNKFLLGFFNSFFLSLPISVVHIIAIRRLLIQGIPSGVYSIAGYSLGQILFLTCTVFGIRELLIPWLTLEPLNYLIGVVLIFRIIYSMTAESLVELKGWSDPKYKNFFLTSFGLAWCEQTSVFQYLGNVTLSSNVTMLESFSSTSSLSSFFTHILYVLGIGIGSVLFTGVWGFFFLQLKKSILFYTPLFTSSFIQFTNKTTFILVLALSLTSIPFYGVEYLVTGPLGFVSQDSVFKNTPLDQSRIKDYARGTTGLSGVESNFQYIDLDLSPFDRGEYLRLGPPEVAQSLSFEDLNYRGEFDWTTRNGKVSGITDSRSGLFTLSKLFKKEKKTQIEPQSPLIENLETNRLIPKTTQPFDSDFFPIQSEIGKRYTQFYDGNTEDIENFQVPYQQISSSSFPVDFIRMNSQFENKVEQKIKDKYYSNPVYKSLLAVDIDLFLKRQPKNFQLNGSQELDLYTKRKILESYYDSLRWYSQLPYNESFQTFFDGAKSFSNKVYNQQFKGTLRSVRRLFTIKLDPESQENQTLLKFDQPLYQFSEKPTFSPYHEELITPLRSPQDTPLRSVQDEPKADSTKHPDFGPTIGEPIRNSKRSTIKKTDSLKTDLLNNPLYAGWDEQLRKFVITNKYLPRTFAGYKVNIEPEIRRTFKRESTTQEGEKIKFTIWPLSKEKLKKAKDESSIPYVTLYQAPSEVAKQSFGESDFVTLPTNLEFWELLEKQKEKGTSLKLTEPALVPKRGGFIWPGNQPFSNLEIHKK